MHRSLHPQRENTNCVWVAVEQLLIFPFAVCMGLAKSRTRLSDWTELNWTIHQGTSMMAQLVKHLTADAGDVRETSSIPGLVRSPGEGNSKPLRQTCLENSMNRGAMEWSHVQRATVHGVPKSWTWLSVRVCMHTHTPTHSHIPDYIQFNGFKVCIGCYLQNSLWNELEVQFSSVQLLSRDWLFATPWTAARQASLSITNSQSPPKPMSIESVMPSNRLILCHPLLLLASIFPSIQCDGFKVCIGCYLQNFLWNELEVSRW